GASSGSTPGSRVTRASTRSPQSRSSTPTTTPARTRPRSIRERSRARSTSWGSTLRPPVSINAPARPSTARAASAAIVARSAVGGRLQVLGPPFATAGTDHGVGRAQHGEGAVVLGRGEVGGGEGAQGRWGSLGQVPADAAARGGGGGRTREGGGVGVAVRGE